MTALSRISSLLLVLELASPTLASEVHCEVELLNVRTVAAPLKSRGKTPYSPRQLWDLFERNKANPSPRGVLPVLDPAAPGYKVRVEVYDMADPRYAARMKETEYELVDANATCGLVVEGDETYSLIGVKTQGRTETAIARSMAEELAHARFNQFLVGCLLSSQKCLLFVNDQTRGFLDEFLAKYVAAHTIRDGTKTNLRILSEIFRNYPTLTDGMNSFLVILWAAMLRSQKPFEDLQPEDVFKGAYGLPDRPMGQLPIPARLDFVQFRQRILMEIADELGTSAIQIPRE